MGGLGVDCKGEGGERVEGEASWGRESRGREGRARGGGEGEGRGRGGAEGGAEGQARQGKGRNGKAIEGGQGEWGRRERGRERERGRLGGRQHALPVAAGDHAEAGREKDQGSNCEHLLTPTALCSLQSIQARAPLHSGSAFVTLPPLEGCLGRITCAPRPHTASPGTSPSSPLVPPPCA